MNQRGLARIDRYIAAWGVIATIAVLPLGGISASISTAVGGGIALLNWMVFRYLVVRLVASSSKSGFGVFLGMKTVVLLAFVTLLCLTTPVEPVNVIIGFSALLLGIVTYSFKSSLARGDAAMKREI